jgi:hypothetical protein
MRKLTTAECAVGYLQIRHGVSTAALLCSSIALAAVWSLGTKMRLRLECANSANDG